MARRPATRLTGFVRSAALAVRILFGVGLSLLLLPCLFLLCSSAGVGTTLTNPAYLSGVLRETGIVAEVRDQFITSLVGTMGLPPAESAPLREALAEGIRVEWLEAQSGRIMDGVVTYLGSEEEQLSIEIPLVELKVYLLAAIRKHMGEEAYLQAALAFQDVPDVFDLGTQLDTATLDRLRPAWRAVTLAPLAGSGVVVLLSALLWLVAGGRVRGVAVVGGVWLAAGLTVVGAATATMSLSGELLASFLPAMVPELGTLPLHEVVIVGLDGLRSEVLATGVGVAFAGLFMAVAPRAVREKVQRVK